MQRHSTAAAVREMESRPETPLHSRQGGCYRKRKMTSHGEEVGSICTADRSVS